MSKLKVFLIFLLLITMCACKKGAVKPVAESFCFNAHISYFNKEYVCAVTVEQNGDMCLSVTEPQILAGAKIVLKENEAYAEFEEIKYPVDIERAGGAPYFLLGVLNEIRGKTAQSANDEYVITGEVAGEDYKITFGETGIPIALTGKNTQIEFMDVNIIK